MSIITKDAPIGIFGALAVTNITLQDWVLIITAIYTLLRIVSLIIELRTNSVRAGK